MRVMELGRVVHDEETARLQVDMNHAPWLRLRAYGHAPYGAKRHERDREPFANLGQVIVVRGDAIPAVTIEVEAHAVEWHTEAVTQAARNVQDCARRGVGC